VVLRCTSHRVREHLRRSLIAERVYPAVLWDLEGSESPDAHLQLSRQVLVLHADFRWAPEDMRRVAALVRKACAEIEDEDDEC